MSTDWVPNHRLCPDGKKSLYTWTRAVAKGRPPTCNTPTVSTDVGRYVYLLLTGNSFQNENSLTIVYIIKKNELHVFHAISQNCSPLQGNPHP